MPRKLIYFCPETRGGVADYARAQAEAISKQGVDLLFLTCPSFDQSTPVSFRLIDGLKETPKNLSSFRWIRRYQHLQILLKNLAILRGLILSLHVKEVLWSSFFEYGSPFWAGHFQDLHRHGVRMGALLHDPIRDFQIGPHWWHQKSIRTATSLFDCLFTHLIPHHSSPHPNPLRDPKNLKKTTLLTHGLYSFPPPSRSREQIRRELNTDLHSRVWLVFGHLRNGKNLDLIIDALRSFPNDTLWVIGKEQSKDQKSILDYMQHADNKGIASQCRWIHTHLPESEVGNYFQASDGVLLTYSKEFHSSSGVLSHAVHYRRPVIASGGESGLIQEVQSYHLGLVIEADSAVAIEQAMRDWNTENLSPDWLNYEKAHSWEKNARLVLNSLEKIR